MTVDDYGAVLDAPLTMQQFSHVLSACLVIVGGWPSLTFLSPREGAVASRSVTEKLCQHGMMYELLIFNAALTVKTVPAWQNYEWQGLLDAGAFARH